MVALLRLFIDLCLLRAKPQDLPASPSLLGATLISYTLTSLALATAGWVLERAILYALVDALTMALLTHTMLLLRKVPARLTQTLTALAGSGTLLGLAAWPLVAAQSPLLLSFVMMVWSIAVTANILRHALSVNLTLGILASLGYVVVTFVVMGTLFPAAS